MKRLKSAVLALLLPAILTVSLFSSFLPQASAQIESTQCRQNVQMSVQLQAPRTDDYVVWLSVRGEESAKGNIFIEVDGDNTCYKSGSPASATEWSWVSGTSGRLKIPLKEGARTVRLTSGEDTVNLNDIIFTLDERCTPIEDGTNCTDAAVDMNISGVPANTVVSGKRVIEVTTSQELIDNPTVTFAFDGKEPIATRTTPPYCISIENGVCGVWDSNSLKDGKHSLTVELTLGETVVSKTIAFTVENEEQVSATPAEEPEAPTPTTTVTTGDPASQKPNSSTSTKKSKDVIIVGSTEKEEASGQTTVTIPASKVTKNETQITYSIDDEVVATVSDGELSAEIDTSQFPNGEHTITAEIASEDGNKELLTSKVEVKNDSLTSFNGWLRSFSAGKFVGFLLLVSAGIGGVVFFIKKRHEKQAVMNHVQTDYDYITPTPLFARGYAQGALAVIGIFTLFSGALWVNAVTGRNTIGFAVDLATSNIPNEFQMLTEGDEIKTVRGKGRFFKLTGYKHHEQTTTPDPTPIEPPQSDPVPTDPNPDNIPQQQNTIVVRARGYEGSEQMILSVNNTEVKTWDNVSKTLQDYSYSGNFSTGIDEVVVFFSNDGRDSITGGDKNLAVDYIKIDSTIYQTEDPRVQSDGVWTRETDCSIGYKQTEVIACNGWVRFTFDNGDLVRGSLTPEPEPDPQPQPDPTPEPDPAPQPPPSSSDPKITSNAGLDALKNPDFAIREDFNTPQSQLDFNKLTDPPSSAPGSHPDGTFRVGCRYSHLLYDDPIVYPGQPGRAHLHMFYGNTGVNGNTTTNSLMNSGGGSCGGYALNRTGYWMPALHDDRGRVRIPDDIVMYYKSKFPDKVQKYPVGLMMISARDNARYTGNGYNNYSGIRFGCTDPNTASGVSDRLIPTSCPGGWMKMGIEFPQCWDGRNLDSPDHKSHMYFLPANSRSEFQCPSSHPIRFTQYSLLTYWKVDGANMSNWYMSSDKHGGGTKSRGETAHADWWGGWNDRAQTEWVTKCINGRRNCSIGVMSAQYQLIRRWPGTRYPKGASDGYANGGYGGCRIIDLKNGCVEYQ